MHRHVIAVQLALLSEMVPLVFSSAVAVAVGVVGPADAVELFDVVAVEWNGYGRRAVLPA
ncbi:hypothetical protein ISF74_07965 [Burkholderia pseudomallei]|nr:hypothetical protein [Burkholderia pseudomallei]